MAMANVNALISRTPVYRVFCGPDEDSARAIYDVLIHHPELIREEAKDMKRNRRTELFIKKDSVL